MKNVTRERYNGLGGVKSHHSCMMVLITFSPPPYGESIAKVSHWSGKGIVLTPLYQPHDLKKEIGKIYIRTVQIDTDTSLRV